ncbi:MAG TPA: flagellar motor switch protein FliN [Bryobacteraceae bacterium]|nr:flagellar motor switch protein FliN [Bryobacteraceae bacterium]
MPSGVHTGLAGEIATALAAAFEGLTGERPRIEPHELDAEPSAAPALRWRQNFSGLAGCIWMHCTDSDWHAAGAALVAAAGIEETDPEKIKPEFLEVLRQALSAAASAMTAKLGKEIVCEAGEESAAPAPNAVWSALEVHSGAWSATIAAGIDAQLAAAFETAPPPGEDPAPKSKTFDLLLDVELPVSVSFGRAQVALKDVLKLTTGSVVDLNRDIADPVEVIVNNCVIARGEVVVVGGNFGVRIQQVISRQERLRTLK